MNATTPAAAHRVYLHGDPIDDQPGRFFCDGCDRPVAREHFSTCRLPLVVQRGVQYVETHERRYVVSRRWWLRNFLPGDPRFIKDDPENVFRTGTASEQAVPGLLPACGG